MKAIVIAAVLWGAAGAAHAQATPAPTASADPELAWRLDGLESPESVALSADGRSLYVSNVGGEGDARDGNGFIARVSLDGKLVQKAWAKDLNAPKGLALHEGRLFVSDIDTLVELDAATGETVNAWPIADAKFLNDVAIGPGGEVLVADSGGARIYALDNGAVAAWLAHPDLRAINGLLAEKDRLVVTTMGGLLLAVDWRTKAVTRLAQGLGEGDGVAALGGGRYLVSAWPGRLFEVAADGSSRVLIDSRTEPRFINDFILTRDLLIAPNWKPGSLSAYRRPS